jgi:hypothetical protein
MQKLNLLLFVAALAVLAGCDNKEINLYPSFTETGSALVHHEGAYNESAGIAVFEIRDAIDDLDTDGGITDVMVEGIFLDVTKNAAVGYPSNTATSATASIILTGLNGTDYLLVENLTINMGATTQEINLSAYLKKAGVQELRKILLAIAQNTLPSGNNQVGIRLQGSPTPEGAYINAKMDVRIKVVVEYGQEL